MAPEVHDSLFFPEVSIPRIWKLHWGNRIFQGEMQDEPLWKAPTQGRMFQQQQLLSCEIPRPTGRWRCLQALKPELGKCRYCLGKRNNLCAQQDAFSQNMDRYVPSALSGDVRCISLWLMGTLPARPRQQPGSRSCCWLLVPSADKSVLEWER